MIAAIATSPLDVLKTRLQSDHFLPKFVRDTNRQPSQSIFSLKYLSLHLRETVGTLRTIKHEEGWRAFYKGLGPNLVGIIPASAIKFFAYETSKQFICRNFNDGQQAAWVHLLAAVTAGLSVSTATNPIWVVKTRMQLDRSSAENLGI